MTRIDGLIVALEQHGREEMRSAVLAANGTAALRGLSATQSAELRSLGVTGPSGGLTRLGANLRAVMVSRELDRAFS